MSSQIKRRNVSQKSELINDLHEHSINPDSREIYIHGEMDDDEEVGVDFRMCSRFIKNLNWLNRVSHDPVLVHQITCGGDWSYGMAMYDAMRACKCRVTVLAYAHAQSMSSIIIQAADYRVLMPNCLFMIHEGTMSDEGTVKSFLSSAEQTKKDCTTMIGVYLDRVKQGKKWADKTDNWIRKQLQTKMDSKQEWYLDAHEAVEYGFADAVLGDNGYEDLEVLLKQEE